MGPLLFLFIVVPLGEIYLLTLVSGEIGFLNTILLVIATGVVGASLAKSQGVEVLRRMQGSVLKGELPTTALIDGALILFAGALLITPGVMTDVVGFLLLIPMTRWMARGYVTRWARKQMSRGRIHVWPPPGGSSGQWQNGPGQQGGTPRDPSKVVIEGEFIRLPQGDDSKQG